MKPLTLNLSKMSKIDGDKKTSTFKHDLGHTIVILHSALPALQRKQLEKMPIKMQSGGDVVKPDDKTVAKPTGVQGSVPVQDSGPYDETLSDGWQNLKKAVTGDSKAYGGKIQSYDEGGQVPLNSMQQVEANAKTTVRKQHEDASDAARNSGDLDEALRQQHQANAAVGAPMAKGGSVKMYADPQEPVSQDDSAPAAQSIPDPDRITGTPTSLSSYPPHQLDTRVDPDAGEPVSITPPVIPPVQNNLLPNGSMNAPAAAKSGQQGIDLTQQIAAKQAQANATYNREFLSKNQEITNQQRNNALEMQAHTDQFNDWQDDPKNALNSRRIIENMSGGQKIMQGIALFLGGMGQGMVGGDNPAMTWLQSRINADVESQKDQADRKRNIYGAYMKLYDNQNIATNLARATLYKTLQKQIDTSASDLGTAQAAANAASAKSVLIPQANKLILDSAGSLSVLHGNNPKNNISGGNPSTVPGQNQGLPPSNGASKDHLLKPGAQEAFINAQRGPEYANDKDEVKNQLEGADLADKAIDSINQHFPAMHQSIEGGKYYPENPNILTGLAATYANTIGDIPGYLHNKAQSLESIPFGIGPAIVGGAHLLTDTEANRSYDVHKDAVLSSITAALVKAGLTPTDAHSTASDMLPVQGDTEKGFKQKLDTAKEKIRQTAITNALGRHNLIQKRQK